MTRRKTKTETKRKSEAVAKRKVKIVAVLAPKEAGHSPAATATNKKAVLVGLGLGMGPGEVAEAIGIGRSTAMVSFIAMTRRKTKTETKRKSEAVAKRKVKIVAVLAPKEAGHSPEATATNKKAVLVGLGLGMGPGEVAEGIGIGRSTVFGWKRDDPEFSAKWNEARETAWDLEGRLYDLGMLGEVKAITETLKARRPEVWRETRSESPLTTNLTVKMTLEESQERLNSSALSCRRTKAIRTRITPCRSLRTMLQVASRTIRHATNDPMVSKRCWVPLILLLPRNSSKNPFTHYNSFGCPASALIGQNGRIE